MLELVLEIFVELLLNGLFEAVLDLVVSRRERAQRPEAGVGLRDVAWAVPGYLALGVAIGLGFVWLAPQRILPLPPVRGISLVLAPVGTGLLMEGWGRWRRAGGHQTSHLASWYGGAAFALGVALARLLGLALPVAPALER